jgi:hypothetical protein
MNDELLQRLKRDLRELGLSERAGVFERRGVAIARLTPAGDELQAASVKRPSRNSPEWQRSVLRDAAGARDFIADLKKKLAAWGDRDD